MRRGASVIENEDPPFGRWWEKKQTFGTTWVGNRICELLIGATESAIRDLSFYNGPGASETVAHGRMTKKQWPF